MIFYGAGGHAKVVYSCLISQGLELAGIFDDCQDVNFFFNKKVIHSYSPRKYYGEKLAICIGSNKARLSISKRVKHEFGLIYHKSSSITNIGMIGQGSMIMPQSIIQVDSKIGDHVIVNSGAIIEHDSVIGDFAHVGPGAVVCGGVKIGEGATIGANATILPGITVGPWAVVGGGSVIIKSIEKGSVVVGNPARVIRK